MIVEFDILPIKVNLITILELVFLNTQEFNLVLGIPSHLK